MKLVAATRKRCLRCRQEKFASEFAKASRRPDGMQNWCRACQSAYQSENREAANERSRRFRRKNPRAQARYYREARNQAIAHYSLTDPPSCACCGETEPAFLVIDHINGGGNAERRSTGSGFFVNLRARGWPSGYQVLCWNCNSAKQFQGICPHERRRLEMTECA